jgi:hypothetical protein
MIVTHKFQIQAPLLTASPLQSSSSRTQTLYPPPGCQIDPNLPGYNTSVDCSLRMNQSQPFHPSWNRCQPSIGRINSSLPLYQGQQDQTPAFYMSIVNKQPTTRHEQAKASCFDFQAHGSAAFSSKEFNDGNFSDGRDNSRSHMGKYISHPLVISDIDSLAMGTQFPQEPTSTKENVDEIVFRKINLETLHPEHLKPRLPYHLPDNYNSPGRHGNDGKENRVPGPRSSRTSLSDPNGSVMGNRFPCHEPGCNKTCKSKRGLMYEHNSNPIPMEMAHTRDSKHAKRHKSDYKKSLRFKCDHDDCSKRFEYQKDLNRHLETHKTDPPRPFKCSIEGCEFHTKGFTRNDHLIRHNRIQHNHKKLGMFAPCMEVIENCTESSRIIMSYDSAIFNKVEIS